MERSYNPFFVVTIICITLLLCVNMCTKRKYEKIKGIHQIELKLKVPNEKEKITHFEIELPEEN